MKKDLILREKLAIKRTHLANQTTLLAFLRTAMYFFVAGLSINEFLIFDKNHLVAMGMYVFSLLILFYGGISFVKQRKWISEHEMHIGDYKLAYEKE
ncbi:DUF202 domain-containing protein [Flavobacterium sp. CBA20B-1]|uniref:DUF202 domain-containing protein n=1 Tax=unclassified Flavobacterium TaxID=196869 RepID=UPI0022249575|nr:MULTISPECIES: DUF202 domain-containing protein [unclassified Flavobacterium]WCM42963.1 DUF202 domain-containing protein [Flavobacterium sp. CBA20B-1]